MCLPSDLCTEQQSEQSKIPLFKEQNVGSVIKIE